MGSVNRMRAIFVLDTPTVQTELYITDTKLYTVQFINPNDMDGTES